MPVKLQKSQVVRNRATGKLETTHFYLKGYSTSDLIEKYNNDNTRPKDRQKIKNELVRRGGVVFKNESEKSPTP
jgi:hypothetical protein